MAPLPFEPEKATEALVYVAQRLRDAHLLRILGTLYLADKLHLHRYARFIFGDTYLAHGEGPLPRGAHSIAKTTHTLFSRDADKDCFSKSDLECMDEAIAMANRHSGQRFKRLTQDAAYSATRPNGEIDVATIAALAADSITLIQHLADPHPDRE